MKRRQASAPAAAARNEDMTILTTKARVLRLSAEDNILVAGERIDKDAVDQRRRRRPASASRSATRSRRKPIAAGEPVDQVRPDHRLRQPADPAGDWVHEHNCDMGAEHGAFERDYAFCEGVVPVDFVPEAQRATFEGFRRSNGKVGTRNYIGILTAVNCSTTVAGFIAQGDRALRHPRRLSQHRRHRGAEAGQRLRHGHQRR